MKEWKGCQISNDEFWPEQSKIIKICTLIGYFCPKHTMFELKKVQTSYVWWHWRLVQNLKKNWLVLSRMTWRIWQIFIHRLKNSYFILESKMRELNQNKNSKQPDQPDSVKTLIYLENTWIACIYQNCLHMFCRIAVRKV